MVAIQLELYHPLAELLYDRYYWEDDSLEDVVYDLTNICYHEKTSQSHLNVIISKIQFGIAYNYWDFADCTNECPVATLLYNATLVANDEYCANQEAFVSVNSAVDYKDLESTCKRMKGSILTREDVADFKDELVDIEEKCQTDNFVTWIATNNNHDFDSWCKVLKVDESFDWRPCHKPLLCSLCKVQIDTRVKLFGASKSFDRYYTLQKSETGEMTLKGFKTSHVIKENSTWILESSFHDKKCFLNDEPVPFIRFLWNCSEGAEVLAFSPCSFEQFTCDSGMCLSDLDRCDGVVNCDDGSDENECIDFSLAAGYDKSQAPPIHLLENGIDYGIDFVYEFFVASIDDVKTSNFYVDVALHFSIKYKDVRVTLWNPDYLYKKDLDCSEIWTPKFLLMDFPHYGHWVPFSEDYAETCSVTNIRSNAHKAFDDPYMGKLRLFIIICIYFFYLFLIIIEKSGSQLRLQK